MLKKWGLIILAVMVMAGCTTRTYKSNMENGRMELKEERYLEASEAFKKAFDEKNTSEAKDLKSISAFMAAGMEAYEDGEYARALSSFEQVLNYETDEPEAKQAAEKAEEWKQKADAARDLKEKLSIKLEEGKGFLEEGEYAAAEKLFAEVSESKLPEKSSLKVEAAALREEAEQRKQTAEAKPSTPSPNVKDQQEGSRSQEPEQEKAKKPKTQEPKKEEKKPENKAADKKKESDNKGADTGSAAGSLTKEQAEKLVWAHIGMEEATSNLKVRFDHEDENGEYVFQAFETIIDNKETNEGHTATWGWYSVHPKTKKVKDLVM